MNTPKQMERFFEHATREAALYQMWEQQGVFTHKQVEPGDKTPVFCIALPPPNANGELHVGHAYGYTVMDILGRFRRALGEQVLLIPGKDHAGIQTQVIFEKKLAKEGIDFSALPRDELYKRCYDFCIDRAAYMRAQERRLGISCDWSRELFTLDPRLNQIVFDTFVRMWQDGLVYRGTRIVNWSVYSQTAISDVEVEYDEVEGELWFLCYPLAEPTAAKNTPLNISLTPDTLLVKGRADEMVLLLNRDSQYSNLKIGDIVNTATDENSTYMVHHCERAHDCKDLDSLAKKYAVSVSRSQHADVAAVLTHDPLLVRMLAVSLNPNFIVTATTRPETLLGDSGLVVHPDDPRYRNLVGKRVKHPLHDRTIEIRADKRVDLTFGSGVVKVTPAHDFTDYEIGQDHNFEILSVIGRDGRMTSLAGADYAGLTSAECRAKVVADLETRGLLLETRKIKHKVPIAERGKDVIEPLVSEQWFVAVDKPETSLKARALKFLREGKIKVYPARFQAEFEHWLEGLRDWNISRQLWWGHRMPVWYRGDEIAVGVEQPQGVGWQQESDTFDTWFSSGQWAYSTLMAHELLNQHGSANSRYFPNQSMVMGRDILFFWACRMLLMTAYRMNDVPWSSIYFTGLVRDQHGQKMSKSKGNGVDPLALIDKYGADSLRLALIIGAAPGSDIAIGEKKVEGYSKFINKLWNAAKLIEMKFAEIGPVEKLSNEQFQLESSRWLLTEVAKLQSDIIEKLKANQLAVALDQLYQFTWSTFCDWYLEMLKSLCAQKLALAEVRSVTSSAFKSLLTLLHPYIPFVTEEIYQSLFGDEQACLAKSQFIKLPAGLSTDGSIQRVIEAVSAIRAVKVALNIAHERMTVELPGGGAATGEQSFSTEARLIIQDVARVELAAPGQISAERRLRKPLSFGIMTCDVAEPSEYRSKLEKERERVSKLVASLNQKLSSDFAQHAPPELVIQERERLQSTQELVASIERELAA